jgi:hypothetical protein
VAVLTHVLGQLLTLDGRSLPDSPDRQALRAAVAASRWLRFGLGLGPGEPLPDDDLALATAAEALARDWALWTGYRQAVIAIDPKGGERIYFRIVGRGGSETGPPSFPVSTFAILTAWNPGGATRSNDRANERANARLAAHLDARMVERWPAQLAPGTPARAQAFAVLGLERDEAWRLGEAFGQRAVYYVEAGEPWLVARQNGRVVTWQGRLASAPTP